MSNCIEIYNPVVVFDDTQIDVEALRKLLVPLSERHQTVPTYGSPGYDAVTDIAWWFLASNTQFHKETITVSFGRGRSSHTQRDFKAVIRLLNSFMRPGVTLMYQFQIADEMDDFQLRERRTVEFKHEPLPDAWKTETNN